MKCERLINVDSLVILDNCLRCVDRKLKLTAVGAEDETMAEYSRSVEGLDCALTSF